MSRIFFIKKASFRKTFYSPERRKKVYAESDLFSTVTNQIRFRINFLSMLRIEEKILRNDVAGYIP
jgi:hypothetical protein